MKKKNKALIRLIGNVVHSTFGEHTPPEVKNSEKNKRVADVLLALNRLID